MALTLEEIEALNAYGPYNHAVWRGRGVSVTHEESISGRAEFLARLIRQVLVESFSPDEMATMTVADVGSYDGWLLSQLVDLPFKRLVGIEPRIRNIEKGNKVREILHIESRVEFRVGSIESLGPESFDVVICTGLLHHLESVGDALRALRAICRRKLFIETLCLSSHHITRDFVRELEPKDIVYFGKAPKVGLSGHKYESSYFHGSAIRPAIVAIPTVSTLEMFLEHLGFHDIRVLVPPSAFWSGRVTRASKACCLVADPGPVSQQEVQVSQILDYENGLLNTMMPAPLIERLYERFCQDRPLAGATLAQRVVIGYASQPEWLARLLLRWIRRTWADRLQVEIIKNLRYAPADKTALEMAKLQFAAGDFSACIETARKITTRLNADWRATYRAFLLIARAYRHLGDTAAAKHYAELCRLSNPELPEVLFEGIEPA
jgi:hypothetical protein